MKICERTSRIVTALLSAYEEDNMRSGMGLVFFAASLGTACMIVFMHFRMYVHVVYVCILMCVLAYSCDVCSCYYQRLCQWAIKIR